MVSGKMLRLTQSFSLLNVGSASRNCSYRYISRKNLFEKLGLPEKPKKPLTGFFLFKALKEPEIKKKYPNANVIEYSRAAAKMWKDCEPSEKEKFYDKYRKDYQEYKVALKEYSNSLTDKQKSEIKEAEADLKTLKDQKNMRKIKRLREMELQKPKKPCVPFFKFMKLQQRNNFSPQEFVKVFAGKWSELPESSKRKFFDEYKEEYKQYLSDLKIWEEKMINEGHVDVVRSKTLKQKLKFYS